MIDDHRNRILQAAARIYTQHGWRGATTKRIAEEAGVNEVTLFRQFGAKDALLEQMMRDLAAPKEGMTLPDVPQHPEQELVVWAQAHHQETCGKRPLIRQMMSDFQEHPHLVPCATESPNGAIAQLRAYVLQLRAQGFIGDHEAVSSADMEAAVTMLMGAVFADGMNRDVMPDMFTQPAEGSLRSYVRLFLRGLGALSEPVTHTAHAASSVLPQSTHSA
jgi:AcrR family transcriptional regulator